MSVENLENGRLLTEHIKQNQRICDIYCHMDGNG